MTSNQAGLKAAYRIHHFRGADQFHALSIPFVASEKADRGGVRG